MTRTQYDLLRILDNLKILILDNEATAEVIVDALNPVLDELRYADFFGPVGQYDPREDTIK